MIYGSYRENSEKRNLKNKALWHKSALRYLIYYLSYSGVFVLIVDDPWMAAHQFLERNDLSQMFLDQVVDFIQKNTEGVTIGQQAPSAADPFTGDWCSYTPDSFSFFLCSSS